MEVSKRCSMDEAELIFRPWYKADSRVQKTPQQMENSPQNLLNSTALDLSIVTTRTHPTDYPNQVPTPMDFDDNLSNIETPQHNLRGIWNPALFQQLQVQAYLHNLQVQLLSMAKFSSGSGASGSGNIYHVHQQALFNAQLQHAKSQALKCPDVARPQALFGPSKYPVQTLQSAISPGVLCHPNQRHSIDTNSQNANSFPLPSAKDGEPLDLLPKSLYLNKSQGGHLCIFCGKVYSRKYGLKIHLRTHTGYKPLKCKVCARPFGDPSNLNKHIRLHAEGETPYRCMHCGKVLVRRRDLERHIRSRHPQQATYLTPDVKTDPVDDNYTMNNSLVEPCERELNKVEELDVVG